MRRQINRRVERLEGECQSTSTANAKRVLFEVVIDEARAGEEELFVQFNGDTPIGMTYGFDELAQHAKRIQKDGGAVWAVFDPCSCGHTPCAAPYTVNVATGGKVYDVRVCDDTLFQWRTFKRGDFLKAYTEYKRVGESERVALVAQKSELLNAFTNKTHDEWRAVLGLALFVAMTQADQAALLRGHFAALSDLMLDSVIQRCENPEARKG